MAAATRKVTKSKSASPAGRTKSASKSRPSSKPAPRTSKRKPAATRAKPVVKKPAPATPAAKKAAKATAPAAGKNKKRDKPPKAKKVKLVRDSFTMPEGEYAQLALLKKRCLKAGMAVKKSEVLRAALASLVKLSDAALLTAMRRLEVIKTGRPAKGSK